MTECTPLISYAYYKDFIPKSTGKLLETIEAKLDHPDYENNVGEICLRGKNVMSGYYKNPEATVQVIDKDGWLHIGDLASIDSEGNIYIYGRNKTMILNASGQNIYPKGIEEKPNNMSYIIENLVIKSNGKLNALVYPDYEIVDLEGIDQNQ